MKYLMIFEDGNVTQTNEILDGDDQSVRAGILEVVRFEGGKYQRWCPGEQPEWAEV